MKPNQMNLLNIIYKLKIMFYQMVHPVLFTLKINVSDPIY